MQSQGYLAASPVPDAFGDFVLADVHICRPFLVGFGWPASLQAGMPAR